MLITSYKTLIIIWYNPNKNLYYHRAVRGFYCDYSIGYENCYGHIIVDMFTIEFDQKSGLTLKQRLIKKLIRKLERSERR